MHDPGQVIWLDLQLAQIERTMGYGQGRIGIEAQVENATLRDTEKILAQAARTLDFSRPAAVMLIGVLHLIGDDDDPYGIVAKLMNALPPGSYLALSHVASDIAGGGGGGGQSHEPVDSREEHLTQPR